MEGVEKGSLYICGTPIGNLEDISLRCLRILKEVSLIAAEDTRHTRKLLNHYQIKTKTTSLHQNNEKEKTPYLLKKLAEGISIALVSSAGMPLICDPGLLLIKESLAMGIQVIPIPGPTAFTTALVISGLSSKSFVFLGFLPKRSKERRALLSSLIDQERTLIFYEAPHRIGDTLQDIGMIFSQRKLVLIRELTKIHEERLEGTAQDLLNLFSHQPPKGEFTLLLEGSSLQIPLIGEEDLSLKEHLHLYLKEGFSKREAIKRVSQERDLPKRQVYKEALHIEVDPKTGKVH